MVKQFPDHAFSGCNGHEWLTNDKNQDENNFLLRYTPVLGVNYIMIIRAPLHRLRLALPFDSYPGLRFESARDH